MRVAAWTRARVGTHGPTDAHLPGHSRRAPRCARRQRVRHRPRARLGRHVARATKYLLAEMERELEHTRLRRTAASSGSRGVPVSRPRGLRACGRLHRPGTRAMTLPDPDRLPDA